MWEPKHTFDHILNNVCDIPLFQLLYPCIKGDMVFEHIFEDVYFTGLKNEKVIYICIFC